MRPEPDDELSAVESRVAAVLADPATSATLATALLAIQRALRAVAYR